MEGRLRGSEAAGGAAAELTERVLRWFLRGGTWPGLAREIAWQAMLATGAEDGCVGWLTGLVEERLAQRIDGLEFHVARASAAAAGEHLRAWPHDVGGGETAALLEGHEEAAQALVGLYVEVLGWAGDLLATRLRGDRRGRARRLRLPKRTRPTAGITPPAFVAEVLERPRERFGWPSPRAA